MTRQRIFIFIGALFFLACGPGTFSVAPFISPPKSTQQVITPTFLPVNTYYVSLDGNDANPGTLAEPWGSIQKAVDTMTAGDLVYVRGGQYDSIQGGWVFKNSGTATQPITITNYPGEQVVLKISTAAQDDSYIFKCWLNPRDPASWQTPKADYIRIIGTEVTPHTLSNGVESRKGIVMQGIEGEQSPAVIASDCDYWEVAGIDFVEIAYGIFTKKHNWSTMEEHSTDAWFVHDNRVYIFYRESGMQFNGNYNRIENNEIYKVTDRIDTPYGCQLLNLLGNNNIIRGNTLDRAGSAAPCIGVMFEWDLADANLVEQNTILDVRYGISIQGGDKNIILDNHIVGSPGAWAGVWAASYKNRTGWPCNDYAESGFSVETILPPDNPAHPDYSYYYNPRNCRSMSNEIVGNTILGFENSWIMYPEIEDSNMFSDSIASEP